MYIKFSKCEFWLDRIGFLRHVISSDSICVDPQKVEVVSNWDQPTIMIKVRSFLGLAAYYNRFMRGFLR